MVEGHSFKQAAKPFVFLLESKKTDPTAKSRGENRKVNRVRSFHIVSHCKNRWFDNECKNKKQSLNRARKIYQESLKIFQTLSPGPYQENYVKPIFQQRREYKKLIKNKRQSFLDTEKIKLWSLNSESPKLFWKKLSKGRKKNRFRF